MPLNLVNHYLNRGRAPTLILQQQHGLPPQPLPHRRVRGVLHFLDSRKGPVGKQGTLLPRLSVQHRAVLRALAPLQVHLSRRSLQRKRNLHHKTTPLPFPHDLRCT